MNVAQSCRRARVSRPVLAAAAAVVAALALLAVPASAMASAPKAWTPRSFTCSGSLADLGTYTVTGQITGNVPYRLAVAHNGSVVFKHPGKATPLGSSVLHPGYLQWDVTGAGVGGDLYYLSIPPVLPGQGGYFDADLEILYNGGQDGSNQLPMFDCTVTGGSPVLSFPPGPRSFNCAGNDAEVARTVTGSLTPRSVPRAVTVTQTGTGTVVSEHLGRASLIGPSALHSGYLEWDITGAGAGGDLYHLSTPPVLPAHGGYFDADLEILFNGGQDGNVQIPMFDCTVG